RRRRSARQPAILFHPVRVRGKAGYADVEERAAGDVAGLVERDLDAVHHLYGDVVAEPFEAARRGFRCGGGVEGESRTVLAIPTPVRVTRFLFLQVSAVGKEQPGQVARPFAAQRAPHETLRAQPRQEARVIDVRVREDHRVELAAGQGAQFRSRSSFRPWNSPASTRTR